MTKNEIINELYNTDFVQKYTHQLITSSEEQFLDDITNDIWLIICEQPEERLQQMYKEGGINQVRRFASGIIHRSIVSTSSPIHKRYKAHFDSIVPRSSLTIKNPDDYLNNQLIISKIKQNDYDEGTDGILQTEP